MSVPAVAGGSQKAGQRDDRERRVQQEQDERPEQTATADGEQQADIAVDVE